MRPLVIVAILAGSAGAAPSDFRTEVVAAQAKLAKERASVPGADPWIAGNSASLFTRPSFWDALKVSNDTTEEKSTFSLAVSPALLTRDGSVYLRGLQLAAAYTVTNEVLGVGLKWNLDLRDYHWMSERELQALAAPGEEAFQACLGGPPVTQEQLERCSKLEAELNGPAQLGARLSAARRWRPVLALAIGGGYDFENERTDVMNATLSAEMSGAVLGTTLAITLNAEASREPPAEMQTERTTTTGGGLQLSDTFSPWSLAPVTVSAGGKLLACLGDACADDSLVRVAVGLAVEIAEGRQIGGSVKWEGTGAHLGDAILGIGFSASLNP